MEAFFNEKERVQWIEVLQLKSLHPMTTVSSGHGIEIGSDIIVLPFNLLISVLLVLLKMDGY